MSTLRFLRGKRIVQQLNEMSTYDQLYRNIQQNFDTTKRQYATVGIVPNNITYTPYQNNNTLEVRSVANSKGTRYNPTIMFLNVDYQPDDTPTNITFMGSDGEEHHCMPVNLNQTNVKVHCNCLDFYYRFATWNYNDDSLVGSPPPPYVRKTTTRPPVNPARTPGLCKHLIKLVDTLKRTGLVR